MTAHWGRIAGPRPDSMGFSGGLLLLVPVVIGSFKRPVLSIRGIAMGASGGVLFGSFAVSAIFDHQEWVDENADEVRPVCRARVQFDARMRLLCRLSSGCGAVATARR